jgi:GT2 family glycosyltransferase
MDDRSGAGPPELSVVLSTLGNYAVLRRVLDGYAGQDAPPGSFELIVVVDQADPNPAAVDEAIGHRPYPVRRLTGRRPGLSANRNTGWPAAKAPVVLITDNDTIPVPGLASEHISWHRRFPPEEVAVVGHVRWAPELRITPFMRWLDHGFQFDYPSINGIEASWTHLYGANSSIKKRFIERVGDWDEVRLPYLYDDLDWAYRASKVGLRVVYNRDAIVDHLRTDATLEFWKEKMRRLATTEHQFTQIHPELEPWFHRLFSQAAEMPPASGRGVRLASFAPRWVPWLGPRVWRSADLAWKQALAPHFLAAWEEAVSGSSVAGSNAAELVLGRSESPFGSRP